MGYTRETHKYLVEKNRIPVCDINKLQQTQYGLTITGFMENYTEILLPGQDGFDGQGVYLYIVPQTQKAATWPAQTFKIVDRTECLRRQKRR
jgi:hypothetical protein